MKQQEQLHRIIEKNPETRQGVCAKCGPVRITPSRNSWRCSPGSMQSRGDGGRRRSRHHGLTFSEARALWQGKPCDICGRPAKALDHDHVTGQIRGPLCTSCNFLLGCAGDDVERLRAAADYLLRYRGATPTEG